MVFIFLFFSLSSQFSPPPSNRASRKCHRKTLLYISGLGMMIFIFIAAILVRRMEGFSSQSFLNAQTSIEIQTVVGGARESYDEVYLLISILCYNSFSAIGVMVLPWTLISELYPIKVSYRIIMSTTLLSNQ